MAPVTTALDDLKYLIANPGATIRPGCKSHVADLFMLAEAAGQETVEALPYLKRLLLHESPIVREGALLGIDYHVEDCPDPEVVPLVFRTQILDPSEGLRSTARGVLCLEPVWGVWVRNNRDPMPDEFFVPRSVTLGDVALMAAYRAGYQLEGSQFDLAFGDGVPETQDSNQRVTAYDEFTTFDLVVIGGTV